MPDSPTLRGLIVDYGGVLDDPQEDRPGLIDLVAGRADFTTVIQPDEGPRLNLIARGRGGAEALVAGRDALGLTFDALGEAYDWVIACLAIHHVGA